MNKVIYGVVEETYRHGMQMRQTYGIVAYENCEEDKLQTIVASAHDITNDRQRADKLAEKCNRESLSLLHFKDVVEDFLGE